MHFSVAILVALFVVCANCFTQQEYQGAFALWMREHQKSYSSSEFGMRYSIFMRNMDYVEAWNARGSATILGLTSMADLTNDEYQRIYLGTHISKVPGEYNRNGESDPDSVDWTQQGAVTPVKNQGQCGDCWAFSTTGSVEGIHEISSGNLVSLSEQNLCDCSTSNYGCNGGLITAAFQYIIDNGGIDTEDSYPYQGVQGSCQFDPSNVGANISSYDNVPSGNEGALEDAVVEQPVSVAIDASHQSFQLYTGGVYYEPACSSSQLDHGVLVVGYGTSNGADYWLVKNSWGTSWGLQGYIMMARNQNNNCGIATAASYPSA